MICKPTTLPFSPLSALLPAAVFMICGTLLAGVSAANGLYPESNRIPVPQATQQESAPDQSGPVSRVEPFDHLAVTLTDASTGEFNNLTARQVHDVRATRPMSVISYRARSGKVISAELIRVRVGTESS